MRISKVTLKNFRCFDNFTIDLNHPIVLLEGENGSGKTSILEALYYACYLRSFRTHVPKDLMTLGTNDFFIKLHLTDTDTIGAHDIQIGFAQGKKLVKIGQKPVSMYKELLSYYRVISLTEDDLALVQESPQIRRSFIDHVLMLQDPDTMSLFRQLRSIVNNRNALLSSKHSIDTSLYQIISEQLWNISSQIVAARITMLKKIEDEVNILLKDYFDAQISIALEYNIKKVPSFVGTFADFASDQPGFAQTEFRFGRSLFGAHLDDFSITYQNRDSRSHASRGQQKLIVCLIKIAHLIILSKHIGPAIFLLDDFLTDFDEIRLEKILDALANLKTQLIFTVPITGGILHEVLTKRGAFHCKFTN